MSLSKMMSIELGAILLHVSDLARAKEWFEKIFGMETVDYDPEYLFLKMTLGHATFYVEAPNPKLAPELNKAAVGVRSQAVFQVEDVELFIAQAEAMGVRIVVRPVKQYYGGTDAIIADPDGNEFIIHEREKE